MSITYSRKQKPYDFGIDMSVIKLRYNPHTELKTIGIKSKTS